MDRLLLPLIGALALLCGGAAGAYGWDHHGPMGFHTRILFWRVGFDLPPSLAQQRDAAVAAASIAQDGFKACRSQLDTQNTSIAASAARGRQAMAQAQHDIEAARAVAESARRASATLRAYVPQGADVCAKWEDADRAVLDTLNAKVIP